LSSPGPGSTPFLRHDIDTPVEIEDVLNDRPYEKPYEECITTALENRPEIRAYALRLEQSKRVVQISQGEYYPTVHLVGNYAKYGDTPGVSGTPLQGPGELVRRGSGELVFLEWGKTKNRVEAGQSRERQAADMLANTRDQITLEVKIAFSIFVRRRSRFRLPGRRTSRRPKITASTSRGITSRWGPQPK